MYCFCYCSVAKSCSTVVKSHGLQPARLLCPWNLPGKNTGVCCCHHFLHGIFPIKRSNSSLLHWQADSLPLSHLGSNTISRVRMQQLGQANLLSKRALESFRGKIMIKKLRDRRAFCQEREKCIQFRENNPRKNTEIICGRLWRTAYICRWVLVMQNLMVWLFFSKTTILERSIQSRLWFFLWSYMDMRVGL